MPLLRLAEFSSTTYRVVRSGFCGFGHRLAEMLERRGCASTKSYLFFTCDSCAEDARAARALEAVARGLAGLGPKPAPLAAGVYNVY